MLDRRRSAIIIVAKRELARFWRTDTPHTGGRAIPPGPLGGRRLPLVPAVRAWRARLSVITPAADAKVGQLNPPATTDQHVLGFHVAMHDTATMSRAQTKRDIV